MFKVLIRAPSPGLNRLLREDVLDGNTASPCNVQIRQSVTFQKCFRRGKCLKQERCEICGHSCYSEDNQGDHMHLIHGNIFITIMATIFPEYSSLLIGHRIYIITKKILRFFYSNGLKLVSVPTERRKSRASFSENKTEWSIGLATLHDVSRKICYIHKNIHTDIQTSCQSNS